VVFLFVQVLYKNAESNVQLELLQANIASLFWKIKDSSAV